MFRIACNTLLLLGLTVVGLAGEARSSRESLAVSYPEGSTVKVKFAGTMRLPNAKGEARVTRQSGATDIRIELDNMKPAMLFGGDFSTYVLWTVSPEGIAVNTGELVLDGDRSKLRVSTPLTTFGMFVTAEPHYLVQVPSRFVVLDNTDVGLVRGSVITTTVTYRGFDGVYNFERESLVREGKTEGEFRVDRQQAQTAVRLAERAGAKEYAPEELQKAQEALSQTIKAFVDGLGDERISLLAHQTVRLAVQAQEQAERRAREAERRENQQQIASLRTAKEEAERARRAAEQAATQAQNEAKEARQEQEKALRAKAEADQAAAQARNEQRRARELMLQAQQEAQRLAQRKAQAESDATRARREAEEARNRMQMALSRIAETTGTARGVIVNLPDILFDTGQATLRPAAREVLSRVAGVLLVAPEYPLSIEGHTDSVGSSDYNQRLSERRAESVRDYLVEAKVPARLITTAGFGETQPVATNSTAAGRQKNRRVEIVIETAASP